MNDTVPTKRPGWPWHRVVAHAFRLWGHAAGHTARDLRRIEDYLAASVRPADPRDDRDELQRPREDYFPGLTTQAWHDATAFEWTARLERAAAAIRDEFRGVDPAPHPGTLVGKGAWNAYYFRSFGRRLADHCRRCPDTAATIDSIPRLSSGGVAYFSVLQPGSWIRPHCGPTNTRLRCHLPLIVPDGDCGMRVGAETRAWKEHECFLFDDSFEHEVWNETDSPRVVLIVDVWHPDLSDAELWAVKRILRIANLKKNARTRLRALRFPRLPRRGSAREGTH